MKNSINQIAVVDSHGNVTRTGWKGKSVFVKRKPGETIEHCTARAHAKLGVWKLS